MRRQEAYESGILERPQPLHLDTLVEGACVECLALTEAVVLYGGEAEFLCLACQERIRLG